MSNAQKLNKSAIAFDYLLAHQSLNRMIVIFVADTENKNLLHFNLKITFCEQNKLSGNSPSLLENQHVKNTSRRTPSLGGQINADKKTPSQLGKEGGEEKEKGIDQSAFAPHCKESRDHKTSGGRNVSFRDRSR